MKKVDEVFSSLPVTVVGSYPASPSPEEMMAAYHEHEDPFIPALERAVTAQLHAGVDVVSDGQTRADMVAIFASKILGVRMKGRPVVIGDLEFVKPITVDDTVLTQKVVDEYPGRSVKGIITGPYTMAMSVGDQHYLDIKELSFAMAKVINQEAKALQSHVPIIQFDEPFMSQDYPDYADELIGVATEGLDVMVGLHSCGDVSNLFDKFVELPVDLLDHEFATHPGLLDVVADTDFEQNIGLGLVRSDKPDLEDQDAVAGALRKACDALGPERIMADPDCGLRHQTPVTARQKLDLVVNARNTVRTELGSD